MLLCEQERILSSEQNLLNNNNSYGFASTTLALINDYGNIVVPQDSLVYFSVSVELSVQVSDPHTSAGAGFILKVGGKPIAGKPLSIMGAMAGGTTGIVTGTMGCVIYLAAGTYDVQVWGASDYITNQMFVNGMSAAIAKFNDQVGSALATYTSSSNNITLTVAARNTPAGALNQAVYAVSIGSTVAWGSGLGVSVDGVSQSSPDEDSLTSTWGISAYKLFIPLSVGSSHTITITLSSGTAYVSVVACPWILTTLAHSHSPITCGFPQASTLYANLGSLFYNSVKDAYIGQPKGVTWGANDYYAQGAVVTGILYFSYTFTSVNVSTAFIVDGLGGCIENVGVDIS